MGRKPEANVQGKKVKKKDPEYIWDYIDEDEPDEPVRRTYKAQAPYLEPYT